MGYIKRKLNNSSGESIGETMVALLIATMGLAMLAGAVLSSSKAIEHSREAIDRYYTANESQSGVVKMESGGKSATITITDSGTDGKTVQSFSVDYFENKELHNTPVISYKKHK